MTAKPLKYRKKRTLSSMPSREMALDVIDRITLGNDGLENARVEFKEM